MTEANKAVEPTTPRIDWDDSKMSTTYANVCNVLGTREEIMLLFGANQAWQSERKNPSVVHLINELIGCRGKIISSSLPNGAMILNGVDQLLGMFDSYTKRKWFWFDQDVFFLQQTENIFCRMSGG